MENRKGRRRRGGKKEQEEQADLAASLARPTTVWAVTDAPSKPSELPAPSATSPAILEVIAKLMHDLRLWLLPPRSFQVTSTVLGCSAMSTVYVGLLQGRFVAVKECQFNHSNGLSVWISVSRELSAWPKMDHPNILRFLGFTVSDQKVCTISELCKGGTLFDVLHNHSHIPLQWWQRGKMLTDIASAVAYLHAFHKPLMHRDIKSLNVLLLEPIVDETSQPIIRLADFGFTKIMSHSVWSQHTAGAGTPHWMAPEVIQGTRYSEKADMYSLSIIMYEVVTRRMAFESYSAKEVQQRALKGERPSLTADLIPPETPTELLSIMVQCWDADPNKRFSAAEVEERFKQIPWADADVPIVVPDAPPPTFLAGSPAIMHF